MSMSSTNKATISDVASLAGVSKKTVSRVLNNEEGVRRATREQVQSAIKALHYMPNLNARRLRTNQSYIIGVLYVNYPGHFYADMLLQGAIKACDERGYDLMIRPFSATADKNEMADTIVHMIERSNIDGFIVVPPLSDNDTLLQIIENSNIPLVKVASLNENQGINLHCDEINGASLAVESLIARGHRDIGFVSILEDHAAGFWRYKGFSETLKKHKIEERPEFIIKHTFDEDYLTFACKKMLSTSPRPSAIFATNDSTAGLLYKLAQQLNINIPQDISVIGFDDDPASSNLWPPLTTIRQPVAELGHQAATLLIQNKIRSTTMTSLKTPACELVTRHSVRDISDKCSSAGES